MSLPAGDYSSSASSTSRPLIYMLSMLAPQQISIMQLLVGLGVWAVASPSLVNLLMPVTAKNSAQF